MPNPQPILTRRQVDILRFIRAFVAEKEYFPTLREIALGTGINFRTAGYHVRNLKERGMNLSYQQKMR